MVHEYRHRDGEAGQHVEKVFGNKLYEDFFTVYRVLLFPDSNATKLSFLLNQRHGQFKERYFLIVIKKVRTVAGSYNTGNYTVQ